jgi:hypothetical protein
MVEVVLSSSATFGTGAERPASDSTCPARWVTRLVGRGQPGFARESIVRRTLPDFRSIESASVGVTVLGWSGPAAQRTALRHADGVTRLHCHDGVCAMRCREP